MTKKIAILLLLLLLIATVAETRTRNKENKNKNNKKKKDKLKQEQYVPHYLTPDTLEFWLNALLAAFLALAGGFCSGMTVGLNSLSILNLEIMQKSPDPQTKQMGDRILNVISDHHLFLVTLLVGNAIVLESLPLVIHLIMPDWAAIIFSTIVVLVVAEVVPMSWSTGTHKYVIAFYGCPLVSIMIKLFWPICYPIARGLDALLGGQHHQRILRQDFLTFINDKRKNELDKLQIQFINRVMNHSQKTLHEIMTPFQQLFMLQQNQPITQKVMNTISHLQFSFILIYKQQRQHIIGYIKTKEMIVKYIKIQDHSQTITIHQLIKHKISDNIVRIYNDAIATEALQILEQYKTRIALITDRKKHKHQNKDQSNISIISVYETKDWLVKEPCKIIGILTLNQVLYQISDYQTEALTISQRKTSGHLLRTSSLQI